mgnify:CR=1 FL=1
MQIDWITVVAQIVNFLVLVWLLQRFLYRPITEAMKRREETIERRLAEAKSARKEAEYQAESLRRLQQELEASRDRTLEAAREEADALRGRLEAELRADMEGRRETWRKHLGEERADFATALRRRAGHEVIAITEQVLRDYAQADLVERLADGFVARLDDLDNDTREKLSEAAVRAHDPIIIETNAALNSGSRDRIACGVHEALATDIAVDFRQDENLVLGIRLTIGEQTLEWSAARYLRRLDSALDEMIAVGAPARIQASGAAGV